jgi:hypothetical protein
MKRFALFALLIAGAGFAACSNGNDTGGGCNTSAGPLPVLLYPAPGSSGVSDSPQFVAVYRLGGAGGSLQLVPTGGGATITSAQFALASPGPLPSPSVTAPPGSIVNSAAIAPLSSGTQYTVNFVHNPQPPCGPQQPSGTIGSFTTQ